ncbi:MAG: deoxyguanosinetriphosphate triphosphohydrolase [Actinomycetota bacterium]|nr:deoxyguanosinetriphosphate triphosphohydrolase [Actinomycetota bacterium]
MARRVADEFEAITRERESFSLSPLAVRSYETAGRAHREQNCELRTPFQRDRDRIVHSKAFRRLKGKTQVFVHPRGDHYRTRLTHTLETAGISRTVARALRMNEDLVEAIALGHDLGHAPFGHTGEEALDEALRARFGRGFRHNEHSVRVVDVLERDGRGLNPTAEVRDGIRHHSGPGEPATLEGKIVRVVDRVAYINHDIDDAVRAGVLTPAELPAEEIEILGPTGSRRVDTLVHDLVEHSAEAADITQGEEVGRAMSNLRAFMFERVYLAGAAAEQRERAWSTVRSIFDHLVEHPELLPADRPGDVAQRVADYVAGMTDRFALDFLQRMSWR